MAKVVILKYHV